MRVYIFSCLVLAAFFSNGQTLQEIHLGINRGHKALFHPNSDLIAYAVDRRVKMFRSGIHLATLAGRGGRVQDIDFDAEGNRLLAGHRNGKVVIWDVNEHVQLDEFTIGQSGLLGARFLGRSGNIVLATPFQLSYWDQSGQILHQIENYNPPYATLATSPDGDLVAVAGKAEQIELYDDVGNQIQEISTPDPLISLALSPDKKRLAAGTSSGKVHLWNLESGEHISTLLEVFGSINGLEFSNDGKYLAVGSESLFVVSLTNSRHNMVFRQMHGTVLSSSFSPDGSEVAIVEDLWPYGRIFDIKDLNIPSVLRFKDESDHIPPQIYVSNPPKVVNQRINYSKDLIAIRGSIFDDFGVRSLSVNGIETPIKENGKFIINLPLTMGENQVSIEASDINGNISAKRFVVNRKSDAEKYDAAVARNFLFAVGIDEYERHPDLNNAVEDVNDVAEVLMGDYNFSFSDMTILRNEQATRKNIQDGLRSLIEQVTPRDNLLIYFSGHGHFDELLSEGYWIPVDAVPDDHSSYMANTSVLKVVENINAQHTLLVADACFSGSLFLNTRGTDTEDTYIEQLDKYRSRWGIASGRLEAVSDGEAGQNSPFARVLISYLQENRREAFAASEFVQHMKMNVPAEAGQTPIGGPLRLREDEGGEFIFRRRVHSTLSN